MTTLWAILQGIEWDVNRLDSFECLLVRDAGERLIHRLPEALVSRLATAGEETVTDAVEKWAGIDELACDPSEIQPVLDALVRLSRRSQETKRNLYLWNCLTSADGTERRAADQYLPLPRTYHAPTSGM